MRHAVVLPKGEDLSEWLAVNTVDFFNEISLLYGTISEFCTVETCPIMSAGPNYEYLWAEKMSGNMKNYHSNIATSTNASTSSISTMSQTPVTSPTVASGAPSSGTSTANSSAFYSNNKQKKPVQVSAPEYVDLLMSWVENQLNDENLFPLQLGTPFPKNFLVIVKTIFKRLFRIYAHIYHSHFQKIVNLGAEAHLNTCFKHFIYFVMEFKLIEPKELAPLKDLIDSLMGKDREKEKEKGGKPSPFFPNANPASGKDEEIKESRE